MDGVTKLPQSWRSHFESSTETARAQLGVGELGSLIAPSHMRAWCHTCVQPVRRQALTMLGTSPSMVTRALATNWPNGRPRGAPCT